MPQADLALHLRPAQVEVAVFETQLLGGLRGIGDDERRHFGRGEHLEGLGFDLDLAGRDVPVDRLAPADAPAHADDELVAQLLGLFHQLRVVGAEDDLGQAGAVADVDENKMAHVAGLVDPAAEDDFAALVGGPQGPGIIRAQEGRRSLDWFVCHTYLLEEGSGLNFSHF